MTQTNFQFHFQKNEETVRWNSEEIPEDQESEMEGTISLTELTVTVDRPRLESAKLSSTGTSQSKLQLPSIDES